MSPRHALALSACLALALLAGCARAPEPPAPGSPASPGSPSPALMSRQQVADEQPVVAALRILRGWDRRRAAAYAAGSPALLRGLYAPGSRAGARDVQVLRAYVDRGLVVERLTVQVLRARLVERSSSVVRLRVLDRVLGATAVPRTHDPKVERVVLPAGPPTARVVTLVDRGPRWVVRSVRRP